MEAVTQQIPLEHFLVLSAILFSLGIYGVLTRRSAVLILMSVELMLNAASINMVAFAAYRCPEGFAELCRGAAEAAEPVMIVTSPERNILIGIIFAIFIITVAAAELGLALAIILRVFRNRKTANVDEINELKW